MSPFQAYLILGFEHISDLSGYDHILFLIALCAVYVIRQWKDVLVLVTAFTLGHSVSLAIATLSGMDFSQAIGQTGISWGQVIEFLIPVTILITALANFFRKENNRRRSMRLNYLMASVFGLIHGLGFSNYLRALLGSEESLFQPLLAFNIGLELGQIMIVGMIMLITYVLVEILKFPSRIWVNLFSGVAVILALYLIYRIVVGL